MISFVLIAHAVLRCVAALDLETLRLPASVAADIDPNQKDTKEQLMRLLGVKEMDVSPFLSNLGRNGGMWILSSPPWMGADKLIKYRAVDPAQPAHTSHLTEVEQLKRLARAHPDLAQDPDVAFPSKIIACLGKAGLKQGDFIITRKVPGEMLASSIALRHREGDAGKEELYSVFEKIGRQLKAFHGRYGKQHCDFHAANILVDRVDDHRITFVDLSGIGQVVMDDDVSHFKECLQKLSEFYLPASFLDDGYEHFLAGYKSDPSCNATLGAPAELPAKLGELPDKTESRPVSQQSAFEIGSVVNYYSQSKGRWIPCRLLSFGPSSGLYNLDCKSLVPPERIKLRGPGQEAGRPGGLEDKAESQLRSRQQASEQNASIPEVSPLNQILKAQQNKVIPEVSTPKKVSKEKNKKTVYIPQFNRQGDRIFSATQDVGKFIVDASNGKGVAFRNSKDLDDRHAEIPGPRWGAVVQGDFQDGWLEVMVAIQAPVDPPTRASADPPAKAAPRTQQSQPQVPRKGSGLFPPPPYR